MVRMGDRHGQRVSRVRTGDLHPGQKTLDHGVDLRLFRAAGTDHRLLDEAGRIFPDVEPCAGGYHQQDAASLAQLQRRLRVLVDENLFDGRRLRRAIGDDRLKLRRKVGKASRERFSSVSLELAVGDMRQPVALGADQAPTGRTEPWVEAEDDQASFSKSASLIS